MGPRHTRTMPYMHACMCMRCACAYACGFVCMCMCMCCQWCSPAISFVVPSSISGSKATGAWRPRHTCTYHSAMKSIGISINQSVNHIGIHRSSPPRPSTQTSQRRVAGSGEQHEGSGACSGTRQAADRAMWRAATCSICKLYVSAIWQAYCVEQAEPHSALARDRCRRSRYMHTRRTGGSLVGAARLRTASCSLALVDMSFWCQSAETW